jgi:hypothetical protein
MMVRDGQARLGTEIGMPRGTVAVSSDDPVVELP